jgi:hypothetical protein
MKIKRGMVLTILLYAVCSAQSSVDKITVLFNMTEEDINYFVKFNYNQLQFPSMKFEYATE